jgi:hypothetical protein
MKMSLLKKMQCTDLQSAYRYISELERAYGKYYSGTGYHSRNIMDVSIFC